MKNPTAIVASVLFVSCLALAGNPPKECGILPDFTLPDLEGKETSLAELKKEGPVVVVVLRGFPGYQCPLCTRQVNDLVVRQQEFLDRGATVVLVYPGPSEYLEKHAAEFVQDKVLPDHFHLVLDADYSFTNAYGLRWDAPKETAYPSTFVADRSAKVVYAKISKSHGGRAPVEEVIAAVEKAR